MAALGAGAPRPPPDVRLGGLDGDSISPWCIQVSAFSVSPPLRPYALIVPACMRA